MSEPDPFLSTFHHWIDIFMRRSMRNFIHYARESGLSMSQLGALFHLQRSGICGVSDLGEQLGVTNAAASQMLDRLVRQGLMMRKEDPNDRRSKLITLTEKGSQVLAQAVQARHGWIKDLGEVLSDQEKEQVSTALNILIEKTKHLNPSAEVEIL